MAEESPVLPVLCMVGQAESLVGSQGCTAPLMTQRFCTCGADFQLSVQLNPGDGEEREGGGKHLGRAALRDQLAWGSCACFYVTHPHLQVMLWKRLCGYLVQFEASLSSSL